MTISSTASAAATSPAEFSVRRARKNDPLPEMTLQQGMMLVIQPNVMTRDQKAGVQTGDLVVVTETGAECLHTSPRGPFRSLIL